MDVESTLRRKSAWRWVGPLVDPTNDVDTRALSMSLPGGPAVTHEDDGEWAKRLMPFGFNR